MHIQLFLAACLLGLILGNPDLEDICESEHEKRRDCDEEYFARVPHWSLDSLLQDMPPLQDWKDCIGEMKCDRAKKYAKLSEKLWNKMVNSHKNLQTCLANGAHENFIKNCIPGHSCKDKAFYDCMVDQIKKHEPCNTQAVEAFNALVSQWIRPCHLNGEEYE